MTTSQATGVTYQYSHTVGMDDFSGRAFREAVDLALGRDGMIYLVQRGTPVHRNVSVKLCNVDEEWFGDFGEYGSEPGQMVWPAGIAVDSQERLYVTDEWNQRVSVFDTQGILLDEWGQAGDGDGQLDRPSGIALDNEENLLVVDTRNHRVQRFTRDGKFLARWGAFGSGDGQMNMPWGVAVNRDGQVYVTDWRNDRVQKFTAAGEFLLAWGQAGSGPGQFNRPAGIAVDGDGDVYVADWHNHRVQAFSSEGDFLAELAGDATMSTWGEQLLAANPIMQEQRRLAKDLGQERRLLLPRGVQTDAENRVFIMDSGKSRVQIYRKVRQ